jgi:hypothetical protein
VDPDAFQPAFALAWTLQSEHRLEEALAAYDQALVFRPDAPRVFSNRALLLYRLREFERALDSVDRAMALGLAGPSLHFFRANTLTELCRFPEALAAFDRAIALDPDFADAYRNRGILKLLLGEFASGWVDYEHRRPKDADKRMLPSLQAPDWTGESLGGRSILVSDATGMGDAIHFVRYLPMLAERGARVSFLGNAKLFRLFSALVPSVRFVSSIDPNEHFDFHSKLLSLPYRFGTTQANIPAKVPYLQAEPALVEKWGSRLAGGGFKVGICWRGNPSRTIDAGRSIPLAGFEALARIPGLRLISLQKRIGLEELDDLPASMQVETLGDDFDVGSDAFVDSAAVLQHLDLMISSDTSLAHLAGALGRPIWIALKQMPEWRWQLGRQDSPWYPSMRLFRQSRRDDWSDVYATMARALASLTTC